MTQAAIRPGLMYPEPLVPNALNSTLAVLDLAAEKFAMIGRLYIDGKPAGAKTLSTGTIQFRTGICTFANVGTTLDIGIQDVATGAGPIAQPDGVFDVKTTLTGGAGITTAAWNTATMNSGTKSMTHGDMIAVVFDMTARAGTDSVIIATQAGPLPTSGVGSMPTTNAYVAAAWQTTNVLGASRVPNVLIVFDDGTLGWIDLAYPFTASGATEAYQDSTNPDERGLIFQVPWDCKVDAMFGTLAFASAAADCTFKLYSDPTGTPTLLASQAILAEQIGVAGAVGNFFAYTGSDITLTKNTDYLVTVLATGTANVSLYTTVYNATGHRASMNNGLTLKKATRDGSAGVFTAESPALTRYALGVRICSIDDGTGTGIVARVIGG